MRFDPRYCQVNGKRRYRNHTGALLALVEVVFDLEGRRPDRDKVPRRTYLCPYCGAWHLTSKEIFDEELTTTANAVESTQVSGTPKQRIGAANGENR